MPVTLLLAIWGAGLSTLLAGIKIWQVYFDRKRIKVNYLLKKDPLAGDKIIIHNLSKSAVIIEHWELLWVLRRLFFRKKIVPIQIFNDEDRYLNLDPNSIQHLNFNGQYHFNWNPEIENNVRLFIKLRVTGRKGFLLKVVNPQSN